ncbi:hypothetical protein [Paenibacillus maysiensis]|nr:hypothetical protein [Paenibacillus maysiensis]
MKKLEKGLITGPNHTEGTGSGFGKGAVLELARKVHKVIATLE